MKEERKNMMSMLLTFAATTRLPSPYLQPARPFLPLRVDMP